MTAHWADLRDQASGADCEVARSQTVIHIVDPDPDLGTQLSEWARSLGYASATYCDAGDLLGDMSHGSFLLVRQVDERPCEETIASLAGRLPVVVTADTPLADKAVAAIKSGALDYVEAPKTPAMLEVVIERNAPGAASYIEARQQAEDARRRLSALSTRERQVFEQLARGSSNKDVGRALEISPRTVEIHRANLLTKLRVKNMVEAMQLRYASGRG